MKPKFKAYHKAEKKYCDVTTLTEKGAFLVGVKPGEDQWLDDKSYVESPTNGRFCTNDEFELLQYTGLSDKLGQDIWEGDIIYFKYPDKVDELGYGVCKGVVTFENGCFVVKEIGYNYEDTTPDTLYQWLCDEECTVGLK